MNATLSTRQLQLVGLLVGVVVLAGGYLVVSKHKSNSPSAASSTPAATTPAATTPTQTTPAPSTPVRLNTHGLPVAIALALQKHSIVVVSVATPRGLDNEITTAEAKAAAAEMRAGYVHLNVFHQRPGTAILRRLGVVDTPATLVVKRPGAVYSHFTGLVDRDVVEQAVADARS